MKNGDLAFFGASLPLINYSLAISLRVDLEDDLLDVLFEYITTNFKNCEYKLEVVNFLILLRAISTSSESVKCFFADHFFGLPQCLRMSATSIKRMLLDH